MMIELKAMTDKQQMRYERILKLAEEMIYEQGFYKLSLKELTEKLKISRSTIYENFGSKEGLVEKVVERYNEKLDAGLAEIIADPDSSTYSKFIQVARQLANNIDGKKNFKFHHDLKIHAPHLYERYIASRKRRENDFYKPLIEKGIKEGLFDKTIQPDFLLQAYLKTSQLVCETDILENSNISKTEALDVITRIFLNGAKKIN